MVFGWLLMASNGFGWFWVFVLRCLELCFGELVLPILPCLPQKLLLRSSLLQQPFVFSKPSKHTDARPTVCAPCFLGATELLVVLCCPALGFVFSLFRPSLFI